MKYGTSLVMLGCSLLSSGIEGRAQTLTPGTLLELSRDVSGTLIVNSANPAGCATRICTTNLVTSSRCYTNCYWKLVCTTNTATGQIQCTNVLVCNTRCYTNTFPQITCTNALLTPTTLTVREGWNGAVAANAGCDELDGLFPPNAVFQAVVTANLRSNDWRGTHLGSFKILDGTNVVAYGTMTGVNGVGSHRGLEACALCNHLEGTLRGLVVQSGPLRGARIQASYAGNVTSVTCPSATVPQGIVSLSIDGSVVTPCSSPFAGQ